MMIFFSDSFVAVLKLGFCGRVREKKKENNWIIKLVSLNCTIIPT